MFQPWPASCLRLRPYSGQSAQRYRTMGRTNREPTGGMPCQVIDVQVHAFERNHPGRPWAGTSHGPDDATGDEMVAAMTEVGVDGAVMVSPFCAYGYDPSYALEVYRPIRKVPPGPAGRSERSGGGRDGRRHGRPQPAPRRPHHDARRHLDRPRRSRHQPGVRGGREDIVCRSTCFAGACWTKACRISGAIPTRRS